MRALMYDHRTDVKLDRCINPGLSPNAPTVTYAYPNAATNPVLNASITGWSGVVGTVSFISGDSAVGPPLTGLTDQRGFGRISFPSGAGTQRLINAVMAGYVPTAVAHVAQVWVRGPVGKTIVPYLDEYNGATLVGTTFAAETALTGDWQLISAVRTFTTGTTALWGFYRGASTTTTYTVDFKYGRFSPAPIPIPFWGRTLGRVVSGATQEVILVEKTDFTDSFYYLYTTAGTSIYSQGILGITQVASFNGTGLNYKSPPAWTEYDIYSIMQLATKVGDNNSYSLLGGAFMTIPVDRTYTLAATGYLPLARIYAEHADARRIVVKVTTGGVTTEYRSPQVPLELKTAKTVKVTFDVPSNATAVEVRLYNGGEFPNVMAWDSVALWEGKGDWDYVGPSMGQPWKYIPATGQGLSVGIPTLGKQAVA